MKQFFLLALLAAPVAVSAQSLRAGWRHQCRLHDGLHASGKTSSNLDVTGEASFNSSEGTTDNFNARFGFDQLYLGGLITLAGSRQ